MFRRQSNQIHVSRLTMPEMILVSIFGLLLFLATTYAVLLGLSFICGIVAAVFADGMTHGKLAILLAISVVVAGCVTLPILMFVLRRLDRLKHSPSEQHPIA